MDPALITALIAFAAGGASAFVGYWWGYGNAYREGRIKELRLKAQMHEQRLTALDLADRLYRLKTSSALTPHDRMAFDQIVDNYRKDCA